MEEIDVLKEEIIKLNSVLRYTESFVELFKIKLEEIGEVLKMNNCNIYYVSFNHENGAILNDEHSKRFVTYKDAVNYAKEKLIEYNDVESFNVHTYFE